MDVGSSVIHTSLTSNEIDLYPEYTGTGLISILNLDPLTDPDEVYNTVKDEYEKQFKVTGLIIPLQTTDRDLLSARKRQRNMA
jgi:osmoprotectant transport system substrate-binding protein